MNGKSTLAETGQKQRAGRRGERERLQKPGGGGNSPPRGRDYASLFEGKFTATRHPEPLRASRFSVKKRSETTRASSKTAGGGERPSPLNRRLLGAGWGRNRTSNRSQSRRGGFTHATKANLLVFGRGKLGFASCRQDQNST